MALWQWPKKTVQKPKEMTEGEMRALLRQQVLSDLSREGGLNPEYREDVICEEDFEALMAEMPIFAVWGERWTEDELKFSLSVNIDRVATTIEKYIHHDDPWFGEEHRRIVSELKELIQQSIIETYKKTGGLPSQICEAAIFTRENQ